MISAMPLSLIFTRTGVDTQNVTRSSFYNIRFIGSKERRKIIDTLRNEGNFYYNNHEVTTDEEKIVCRRPQKNKPRPFKHYRVCPSCKGYFSKLSLHRHYRRCSSTAMGIRDILCKSKRIAGEVHAFAKKPLREMIFPSLRDDGVTNSIRYDEVVIIYGNWLCTKYKQRHLPSMIRSRLRLLGRFLIEIKAINPSITCMVDVFDPQKYDNMVEAINKVAGLNNDTGLYGAPSQALCLGTALKRIATIMASEYFKRGDSAKKKSIKDFKTLMESEFVASINSTVIESQRALNRRKKCELPSINDIKKLKSYVLSKRRECHAELKHDGFSLKLWKRFASYTLICILVFNRKRPGELQRVFIKECRSDLI